MKCPICNCKEDRVLETRMIGDSNSIRRRRECTSCGYRFTTYEHIEEKNMMVVKRDKRREPFNIDKLTVGIYKATEKLPISQPTLEELVHSIENEAIHKAGDRHEVSSDDLGEMVMRRLKKLDLVAYIRYASVYRRFKDLEEFIDEIKSISINNKKAEGN